MASNYDLSLSEFVSKNKSARGSRGSRGSANQRRGPSGTGSSRRRRTQAGARSSVGFQSRPTMGAGNVAGIWSLNAYYGRPVALSTPNKPTKLNITNLDFGVSDADINELFSEFPMMRNASIHYDRNGRSLGTAHVIYERRAEALLAIKKYNGVHLDGRPMHVEIDGGNGGGDKISKVSVFKGNRIGPRNNVKRLQGQPNQIGGKRTRRSRKTRGKGTKGEKASTEKKDDQKSEKTKKKNPRRRKAKTEKKGGPKEKKKIPTAEELDAELEEYRSQKNK